METQVFFIKQTVSVPTNSFLSSSPPDQRDRARCQQRAKADAVPDQRLCLYAAGAAFAFPRSAAGALHIGGVKVLICSP